VGIRGLLARTSFRPVESEYRALYSCFTGQKNKGSVRHALTESLRVAAERGDGRRRRRNRSHPMLPSKTGAQPANQRRRSISRIKIFKLLSEDRGDLGPGRRHESAPLPASIARASSSKALQGTN
jgi:hypothetical protein